MRYQKPQKKRETSQSLNTEVVPDPQPWDSKKIGIIGDEDGAGFEGVRRDPNIVDRDGMLGIYPD